MMTGLGRRLSLVFGSGTAPSGEAPEPLLDVPLCPEVEFSAFAEDYRLFGHVRLDAERLSDTLNAHDEYLLVDVRVESLATGRIYDVHEITVGREELLVVEAAGPRGNLARRQRARPHLVAVRLGPYEVRGYVHVTPGADPLLAIRRRRPIVPLTEAVLDYRSAGIGQRRVGSTLLVNRECADWIGLAGTEPVELPDMPVDRNPGRLLKDFTGQLLAE